MTAHATPWRFDGDEALDLCHRETLRMLAALEALADRLAHAAPEPRDRAQAGEIERHFSRTVAEHHADEERHVFPGLEAAGDPDVARVVAMLRQDHAWMEADWRELQPMVDAVACGQAWVDADLLRAEAEVFCALSREHIRLEETLIYPEFRRRLSDAERARMNDEMQRRRQETGRRGGRTRAAAR